MNPHSSQTQNVTFLKLISLILLYFGIIQAANTCGCLASHRNRQSKMTNPPKIKPKQSLEIDLFSAFSGDLRELQNALANGQVRRQVLHFEKENNFKIQTFHLERGKHHAHFF